jgi:uncharacterized protein YbaR (Trm112 family)
LHITLTDVLTCPRCGPRHGLILLADRIEERRVLEGRLGCLNCREEFPIHRGRAELPGRSPECHFAAAGSSCTEEEAFRICAFLGITEGPALLLLAGEAAACAPRVVAIVPHVEAVTIARGSEHEPERGGVSRIAATDALPFRDAAMHGVAVSGALAPDTLRGLIRLLVPGARLVVLDADADTAVLLTGRGLDILLDEEGVVVASSPGLR